MRDLAPFSKFLEAALYISLQYELNLDKSRNPEFRSTSSHRSMKQWQQLNCESHHLKLGQARGRGQCLQIPDYFIQKLGLGWGRFSDRGRVHKLRRNFNLLLIKSQGKDFVIITENYKV